MVTVLIRYNLRDSWDVLATFDSWRKAIQYVDWARTVETESAEFMIGVKIDDSIT